MMKKQPSPANSVNGPKYSLPLVRLFFALFAKNKLSAAAAMPPKIE